MRRRLSLLLTAIALMLLLALPAAASASSRFWVKDRRGHVVGSVRGADVYSNSGTRVGHMQRDSCDPSRVWVFRSPTKTDGGAQPIAAAGRGKIKPYLSTRTIGTFAKSGDHWVVKRRTHGEYRLRGTVAGGCPSRFAAGAVRLLCWSTCAPTYTLIKEPEAGYQPIYKFISSAKKTLDMTMYSLVDAKATAALIADAKRGVAVRVLLDSDPAGGGGPAMNQAAYNDLKAHGVKVKWAWPGVLWHQKSIVRDGSAVAVMTCNLYASYYPVLRDFVVITNNPATVSGVEATFNADFKKNQTPPTPGVVPKGSELIWSPGAQSRLVKLIRSSRPGSTLYTETEQLDSAAIEQALVAAATRGVTVDLTMTYASSYVAGFNTLVAGGVHVSLYPANAPLYIQAKAISVNNRTVYVGSINFTPRMMNGDRNMGIITTNPTVVRGVTSIMASDFAGATPYSGTLTALARPNVTR